MLLDDIIYIESLGNYMKLFSSKANLPIIIYGSLSSITAELSVPNFVQVHRSYVVNSNKIQSFASKTLTMSNGESLPVGRKYQILLDSFLK
jgi:two-component system LytT family response regulator